MSDISGLQDNTSSGFFFAREGKWDARTCFSFAKNAVALNTQYGLWPIDLDCGLWTGLWTVAYGLDCGLWIGLWTGLYHCN